MPNIPAAIVTDIEGTTTPISFVHDVLFPYARSHLADFLQNHATDPGVAADIGEVHRLAPGADVLQTLLGWMDQDAKIGPLKSLQGRIWQDGYAQGTLKSVLYPDVAPALRRWHDAGLALFVYSSGSVPAQKLLFRHAADGSLQDLFSGFFDTATGAKRDPSSYAAITRETALAPAQILFLSDVEAELDAASASGLRTCQLVRPQDGTVPSARHARAADFVEVGLLLNV